MSMSMTALLRTVAAISVLCTGAAQADVQISSKPTANMSCAGGICTPTASDAVLNVTDLTTMLASGDVKVTTGSGATNILVETAVRWASTSRLTLDANQSVEIDETVVVSGTGALTVVTNDGGTSGDLIFANKGSVTFRDLSSRLVVNAANYTLVGDISTLATDVVSNPAGFYALANDYNAAADGTYTSAPVPQQLTGTLEGLGHAISGLTIKSSDLFVGLFPSATGQLRDVKLLKLNITATGADAVGGLEGQSERSTVVGCSATGTILATGNAGGIGGLIGGGLRSPDGSILRSYANVSVTGPANSAVGGIIGAGEMTIDLSYAAGHVTGGDNSYVGGLIGLNQSSGSITRSYTTGVLVGGNSARVGGVVGAISAGVVSDSYSGAAVKGGDSSITGGFVGEVGATVLQNSYSFGPVMGKGGSGFIGKVDLDNTLGPDYWDTDASGRTRKHGCGGGKCGAAVKGLSTAKLQSGLPDGLSPDVWGETPNINNGLPYLLALPPK